MALEALCGAPRRSVLGENRLFDQEELDARDEMIASFPNADDPMKVLTPPFVSTLTSKENSKSGGKKIVKSHVIFCETFFLKKIRENKNCQN